MNIHDAHPVNLSINSSHYFENDLTNGSDRRQGNCAVHRQTDGAGGRGRDHLGNGDGTPGVQVQGGPDVGFYFRDWKLRMDVQGGYGSDNEYGLVAFSRSFDWEE